MTIRCYRSDRTISAGGLSLGAEPRIVAVVAAPDVEATARKAGAQGADLIEVRLDRDPRLDPERAHAAVVAAKAAAGLPVIATIRLAAELGEWSGSEAARLAIFEAVAHDADLLDVELAAREIRERVVELCARAGKLSIASCHDLQGTPPAATMTALAAEAVVALGADVFKICPTPRGPVDVARLLSFVQSFRDRYERAQIVGMALGAEGSTSRIMGPVFGSCMTYGFVEGDAPAAPGQLSIRALREAYSTSSS